MKELFYYQRYDGYQRFMSRLTDDKSETEMSEMTKGKNSRLMQEILKNLRKSYPEIADDLQRYDALNLEIDLFNRYKNWYLEDYFQKFENATEIKNREERIKMIELLNKEYKESKASVPISNEEKDKLLELPYTSGEFENRLAELKKEFKKITKKYSFTPEEMIWVGDK